MVDCRKCQQFDSCYYDYDENCVGFLPSSPQKLQREKQKAIANERLQRYWAKKESKPSNYDRIISKSPEELADWLNAVLTSNVAPYATIRGANKRGKLLDWLKQEVTE